MEKTDCGGGRRGDRRLKVLMLPWLAYGHLSPFLELGRRLSLRSCFDVHLCSTPANLLGVQFPSTVTPVEIHLPELPNLPANLHTTKRLPSHLIQHLQIAFDLSEPAFLEILDSLRPDLLVYDLLQPWAPAAASSRGIPSVLFIPTGSFAVSVFATVFQKAPSFPPPLPASMGMEDPESARYLSHLRHNGNRMWERVDRCIHRSSGFILFKSFREIEGPYIDYLETVAEREIIPLGPLVRRPTPVVDRQGAEVIEWLDGKERASVVFVSFGSEYFMEEEQMREIARGLDLSGLGFIWVVRYPCDSAGERRSRRQLGDILPAGLSERGIVVEGWAPQAAILAHQSTGGFLTHCGWGSVTEGMWYGVPLVALPMHLEQPMNARVVVAAGVGSEVHKDRDGQFLGEEVGRVLREVVVGDGGGPVRKRAREMGRMLQEKEKADREIDSLASKLLQLCSTTTTTNTASIG